MTLRASLVRFVADVRTRLDARYVDEPTARELASLRALGADRVEVLHQAVLLSACGATPQQVQLFAKVAARGRLTREDAVQLQRHGITVDRLCTDGTHDRTQFFTKAVHCTACTPEETR